MTTGYELTLPEFRQLIGDPYYQPTAARLLDDWFGYQVKGERGRAKVLDVAGREVSLAELHRTIQADPEMQGELYRAAMTLWR
ncbi:MAG TPA: hypothetical protein VGF50_02090 [Caulobacteraceae bacterium]